LLNFDENEVKEDGLVWTSLYDPDYKLLINKQVFPEALLQGKKIGEHVIHELQLFDNNLTAENIAFSNSGGDSHTI